MRFQIGACTTLYTHAAPPLRTIRRERQYRDPWAREHRLCALCLLPSLASHIRSRASVPAPGHGSVDTETRQLLGQELLVADSVSLPVCSNQAERTRKLRSGSAHESYERRRTQSYEADATLKQRSGSAHESIQRKPRKIGRSKSSKQSGCFVRAASWLYMPSAGTESRRDKRTSDAWQMKHPFCGLRASRSGSRR